MTKLEAVSTHHAYRAFTAVLRSAPNDLEVGKHIYRVGLTTLTDRVSAEAAANVVADAYRD